MGDISSAFRTLRKAPLASLTIVLTVSLGLGMVAAVFTLLNMALFRADNVHDVHELFGVERPRTADGGTGPAHTVRLRRDGGRRRLHDVFAMVPETDSRGEWPNHVRQHRDRQLLPGARCRRSARRVLTPADDEGVSLLSSSVIAAGRRTPANPAVIGSRSCLINGIRYDIVGVMPGFPAA